MGLLRFRTRLFCYPRPERRRSGPYLGKGWRFSLVRDPKYRAGSAMAAVPFEIVISAHSLERAQYAGSLLLAADSLANNAWSFFGDEIRVMPEDPPEDAGARREHERFMAGKQGAASGLDFAVLLAARASHRRMYQYALFKMRLSYLLCSVHIMDLDPIHWSPGQAVSQFPAHHVALAYALHAAYSAIEELGLEIRASQKSPSMVDGRWNPVVLNDLRKRLQRRGVNLSESIVWDRRDTPTRVERQLAVESSRKAEWAYGKIRDTEIGIEDAIRYASRLRSRVSSHRLPALASSLTHYDVSNVQLVARRLLMESLRCWRLSGGGDA